MKSKYSNIKVVIASRNRDESLFKTISSIASNQIPSNINVEIIIIENGYKSDIEFKLKQIKICNQISINYNFIKQKGKSKSLNYGLLNFCGLDDFIIFTDDDVIVKNDWILNYFNKINEYGPGYFYGGGAIIPNEIKLEKEYYEKYLLSSQRGINDPPKGKNYEGLFIGPNWGCFYQHIEKCGFFDERMGPGTAICLGEETYLQEKLINIGIKPFYICNNSIIHCLQTNIINSKEVLKKKLMIGRRKVVCGIEKRKSLFYLIKISMLFVKLVIYSFNEKDKFRIKTQIAYQKGVLIEKSRSMISKFF